ncbi:hypothetical protein [Mycolicibacterium vaccae]|uniref:hypothetical protein n=1 Tax=Mycolicibacterium vaccae TaxID=1810 RepID=UPI003D02CDF3
MRKLWKSIPWPVLAYVFTLLGFALLGLFVASLAYGAAFAPALGAAMVAAWALAVGCVLVRRHQIEAEAPGADIVLGLDPLRGDTDRRAFERYLQYYRAQGVTEDAAVDKAVHQVHEDQAHEQRAHEEHDQLAA